MHLYVARHGQTSANAEQRYLGALDVGLDDRGREQAHSLSYALPGNIEALVVSPRSRALETARIVGRCLHLTPRVMAQFAERNVGVFEGLTRAEASARYPELWYRNITRCWDAAPTHGETIREVVSRVWEGLDLLDRTDSSQRVLLVAHGFVAKVIRALATGDLADFYDWQLSNGELLALPDFGIAVADLEAFGRALPGCR